MYITHDDMTVTAKLLCENLSSNDVFKATIGRNLSGVDFVGSHPEILRAWAHLF